MNSAESIDRRRFLQTASAVGVAGAVGVVFADDSPKKRPQKYKKRQKKKREKEPPRPKNLRDLEHAHFRELIGQKFQVDGSVHDDTQHQAVLILTEVNEHPHPSDRSRPAFLRKSAFTLTFVAGAGEEIEDGTHVVKHPKLFEMELFLHETERASAPHHKCYVAAFN